MACIGKNLPKIKTSNNYWYALKNIARELSQSGTALSRLLASCSLSTMIELVSISKGTDTNWESSKSDSVGTKDRGRFVYNLSRGDDSFLGNVVVVVDIILPFPRWWYENELT